MSILYKLYYKRYTQRYEACHFHECDIMKLDFVIDQYKNNILPTKSLLKLLRSLLILIHYRLDRNSTDYTIASIYCLKKNVIYFYIIFSSLENKQELI